MPLQNRVDPFGEFNAVAARGLLFGNRGGRFHRDDRTLMRRRWTSRAWICCRLVFKGRHRTVWGQGFTELFFLDEPTALAAGHRPCFECRRADALAFAAAWARGHRLPASPHAPEMDAVLHAQRLDGRAKRRHRVGLDDLPDGAMIAMEHGDRALAVRGDALLPWTASGYGAPQPRPRGVAVDLITPPATVAALAAGYVPQWHPSAG
ncbi:MAG TPA: hypothetical protein VEK73_19965 [Xanthobacteraceae bacterium]|nr:hypothetical protein [Xanthobacteraceae bacterium]